MKPYEVTAFNLIYNDMDFIYSILSYCKHHESYNYLLSLLPYLGLIIDQSKKWGGIVLDRNNIQLPTMSREEARYYEKMRENIKFWETSPKELDVFLYKKFNDSKKFFEENNSTIGRRLGMSNIYGVTTMKTKEKIIPISNTILLTTFVPNYKYTLDNSDKTIFNMSTYAGKLASFYLNEHTLIPKPQLNSIFNCESKLSDYDFGSFIKGPFKVYNSHFLLFSLLNECNKLLYAVNRFISGFKATKLRLNYIFYYYLCEIIKPLNQYFNIDLHIDSTWSNNQMRNSMAHYGLGKVLGNNVNPTDIFGGITDLLFNTSWYELLENIDKEILSFSEELTDVLCQKKINHRYNPLNYIE